MHPIGCKGLLFLAVQVRQARRAQAAQDRYVGQSAQDPHAPGGGGGFKDHRRDLWAIDVRQRTRAGQSVDPQAERFAVHGPA